MAVILGRQNASPLASIEEQTTVMLTSFNQTVPQEKPNTTMKYMEITFLGLPLGIVHLDLQFQN